MRFLHCVFSETTSSHCIFLKKHILHFVFSRRTFVHYAFPKNKILHSVVGKNDIFHFVIRKKGIFHSAFFQKETLHSIFSKEILHCTFQKGHSSLSFSRTVCKMCFSRRSFFFISFLNRAFSILTFSKMTFSILSFFSKKRTFFILSLAFILSFSILSLTKRIFTLYLRQKDNFYSIYAKKNIFKFVQSIFLNSVFRKKRTFTILSLNIFSILSLPKRYFPFCHSQKKKASFIFQLSQKKTFSNSVYREKFSFRERNIFHSVFGIKEIFNSVFEKDDIFHYVLSKN